MTHFNSYLKIWSLFIISTAFVHGNLSFHEITKNTNATQSLAVLTSEKGMSENGLEKNTPLNSDSLAVNLMDKQKAIKKAILLNNDVGATIEKKPKKPLILKKIVVL